MLLNRTRAFIVILALVVLRPGSGVSQTPAVDPSNVFFDDSVVQDIRLAINGHLCAPPCHDPRFTPK